VPLGFWADPSACQAPITNVMPAKAGLQEQKLAEERELPGRGLRRGDGGNGCAQARRPGD